MQASTFSGLGRFFHTHDLWATESAGPVYDRTQEHLGYTDQAVIRMRRMLLRGIEQIQAGADPPHVVRDPARNDFSHIVVVSETLPSTEDWRAYWPRAQRAQSRLREQLFARP
jgi:hypothetical protein